MKRIAIICLLTLAVVLAVSIKTDAYEVRTDVVGPTTADSAGVALLTPHAGQTIRIRNITVWYDNAANTNPVYAGIVQSNAAQSRILWFGQTMTSAGVETISWGPIDYTITGATARAGIRLFVNAASSDSLEGLVEYELIND